MHAEPRTCARPRLWWGEAPERSNDSTEATDDGSSDECVRPKCVPSRELAQGHGSARFFVLVSLHLSQN